MTELATAPAPTRTGSAPTLAAHAPKQWRWGVFSVAFALLFFGGALWSVATPLFAAPDEPTHIVKAAAVVRGEFLGNLALGPKSSQGLVQAPQFYDLIRSPGEDPQHSRTCFHARASVPASCVEPSTFPVTPALRNAGYTFEAWIYNARYPPLYYAVVGLPSYLGGSNVELYLMRLVSALLSALFLALAVTVALSYSRRRRLLIGLVVALTPMVFFLSGVVNPAGFETAAGVCVWTCGVVLFLERLADPPRPLIVLTALSAGVLALIRSLSPFWLGCIGLCLLAACDWRELRAFLRRRDAQVALVLLLVVVGLALSWIVNEHSTLLYTGVSGKAPIPPGTSTLKILETSFSRNAKYIPGMVGVFGWFDTWSPRTTYLIWYVLVVALIAVGIFTARRRSIVVMLGLVAGVVILPVLISSSQARQYGYLWSGRDTLPLAVGLPILASAVMSDDALARFRLRLQSVGVVVVVVLIAIAQFGAFYEALRRYAIGDRGALFSFLIHPSWQPPVGVIAPVVGEAVFLVLYAVLTLRALRAPDAGARNQPFPSTNGAINGSTASHN